MPTITLPPVVVDPVRGPDPTATDALFTGPFPFNGALYCFGSATDTPPFGVPIIYKSVDNGATWTDITGSGSDVAQGFIWCWGDTGPNPEIITFAYPDGGSYSLQDFDLNTETWGVSYGTSGGPAVVFNGDFIVRLSDGTIKLFTGHGGTVHYSVNVGGTWTLVDVDTTLASTPAAGCVDSDDLVCFLYQSSPSGDTQRSFCTLDTSNVLSTPFDFPLIPGGIGQQYLIRIYIGPDDKLYASGAGAFAGVAANVLVMWVGSDAHDNPTWAEQLVCDIDTQIGPTFGLHFQFAVNIGGFPYIFFEVDDLGTPGVTPYYVYYCRYASGVWSDPVFYYDPQANPPPGDESDFFIMSGLSAASCPTEETPLVLVFNSSADTGQTPQFMMTSTFQISGCSAACVDGVMLRQVSAIPPYRQAGGTNFGELNPFYFKVGDQLYQLLAEVQSSTAKRIGMFKRAASNFGGSWADQPDGLDSTNAPDSGSQSGRLQVFDDTANSGKIAVLYLLDDLTSLKICEFDTATDTWGTPTAAVTVQNLSNKFGFTRRSNGVYVVIGTRTGHLYYILNTAGAWGSIIDTSLAVAAPVLAGDLIDASDNSYVLLNETGVAMSIRHLDSSNVLSSAVVITTTRSTASHRPVMCFYGATGIAVGWVTTAGLAPGIVSIAPIATVPVFTDYTVYTPGGPFLNETVSYMTPVLGIGGILNVFFVALDHDVPLDQIMQSTFDGVSAWSTPTIYYNEITNPPVNGVTPPGAVTQFIHTLQAIEFASGWSVATALETLNQGIPEGPPPTLWCTGEFLDPCGDTPTQTLELTKIVDGGSAAPEDFTLTAIGGSPEVEISGPGHVGPTEVSPGVYELSETDPSGAQWGEATWGEAVWGGDYTPGNWDCGGAEMPTPTSVVVPEGGTVACSITNTFNPPPPPPGPGNGEENPVGCFELLRLDVTLTPSRHLPTRGSTR